MVPSEVGLLTWVQSKVVYHESTRSRCLFQLQRFNPLKFQDFYAGLPSSGSAPDKLGEPDATKDKGGNGTEDK